MKSIWNKLGYGAACMVLGAIAATTAGFWQSNPAGAAEPAKAADAVPHVVAANPVAAGKYIVLIGGCNDCHTPGYAPTNGAVPEANWLVGDEVGFRGPWGTSYPSNLRKTVQTMQEADFVKIVRERNTRPPMPWASMHAMSDQDLKAVYAYIRSLGDAGKAAPEWVPPTEEPKTPYIPFMPVFPKGKEPK